MAYEKKDGEITLFLNDKGGVEKRPDFKGEAQINGETYEIAMWNRKSNAGKPFLAGQIKKKEKQQNQ